MDNEFLNNEGYLIGSILLDEAAARLVRSEVEPADFESEQCRALYCAALALADEGAPIDPISLGERARQLGADIPDKSLMKLMEVVPTSRFCADYARRVAADARKRSLKDLAKRICEDEVSGADELLATLRSGCDEVSGRERGKSLLSPLDSVLAFYDHAAKAREGNHFISSGYAELDRVLGGGFVRGGLYILAARPAVGKTAFALNVVDRIEGGKLFVSLEMPSAQIMARRIARLTGIPPSNILRAAISDDEWSAVNMAGQALAESGVYLNDRYDLTSGHIKMLAQDVPNLSAVVVDYLGLILPSQPGGKSYENITAISRELKRMALSLNVPVICLCQLSREVEKRQEKIPRLSDLRDSGAIEQDADGVMFLYRADYYEGAGDAPSLVQLIVAKNRHGRCGDVAFSFHMGSCEFKEV